MQGVQQAGTIWNREEDRPLLTTRIPTQQLTGTIQNASPRELVREIFEPLVHVEFSKADVKTLTDDWFTRSSYLWQSRVLKGDRNCWGYKSLVGECHSWDAGEKSAMANLVGVLGCGHAERPVGENVVCLPSSWYHDELWASPELILHPQQTNF